MHHLWQVNVCLFIISTECNGIHASFISMANFDCIHAFLDDCPVVGRLRARWRAELASRPSSAARCARGRCALGPRDLDLRKSRAAAWKVRNYEDSLQEGYVYERLVKM